MAEIVGGHQVFLDRHGIEHGVELEGPGQAEVADLLGTLRGDVPAEQHHLASAGNSQSRDEIEKGRLAGPVGSADAQYLVAFDVKGQIVDRRHRAIALCQVADLKGGPVFGIGTAHDPPPPARAFAQGSNGERPPASPSGAMIRITMSSSA